MSAGSWTLVALLATGALLLTGLLRRSRLGRRAPISRDRSPTMRPDDPLLDWVAELRGPVGGVDDGIPARRQLPASPARHVARRTALARPAGALAAQSTPAAGPLPAATRPIGPPRPPGRRDPRRPAGPVGPPTATVLERRPAASTNPFRHVGGGWHRVEAVVVAAPRRALLLAALIGAGAGVLLGGPVAGVALAGYGWLGARALVRRQAARQADRLRRKRLDQLCGLAADLRAGLPVLVAAERLGLAATGQTADAPVWASASPDPTRTGAASHPGSTGVAGRAAVRVGRAAGRDCPAPPAPRLPVTNTGPGRAPLRADAGGGSAVAGEVMPVADAGPPADGPAGWPVIDGAERLPSRPVPHAPAWSAVGSEPASTVDAAGGPGSCSSVVEPAGGESRRDGPGRRRPRAGQPPGEPDRLLRLALAAVRLADRTGAPLAELVERIEADARSTDRGLAAAAAQAAGARATAWLLAALPLGGVGLGYGIGVDPVAVLLHTPIGGACAVAAIVLQVAGLLWTERLGGTPGRAG